MRAARVPSRSGSGLMRTLWGLAAVVATWGSPASGAEVQVANAAEFRAAVAGAGPGTKILLAGGAYGAGFHFANLRGVEGSPVVIKAADPANPPVFSGGNLGIHFSAPAHLVLEGLLFTNLAQNGLNIDDGGRVDEPASTRGVSLRGLRIADVGSDGNHDGVKLSGVWNFEVVDCVVERWGTRGGSGIDMVGCHQGLISGNTIRHNPPGPPNCTGVQAKGGSSGVVIRGNRFEHAGGRSLNLGGSTGIPYFRPQVAQGGIHAEARDLVVEGNTIVGSMAAIGFVGVDGAVVRFNTIERPGRWAVRILQENTVEGFVPSRNGKFTDNTVLFQAGEMQGGAVNVGGGTNPGSFEFARNWWLCGDAPQRSRPRLPTAEVEGVYGRDLAEAKGVAGSGALPKSSSKP